MLEYFTVKKIKKNRAEKAEKDRLSKAADDKLNTLSAKPSGASNAKLKQETSAIPVLDQEDEKFLERLTSPQPENTGDDDDGPPPPLPPRVPTPVMTWDDDADSFVAQQSGKGKELATSNTDSKKADDKKAGNRFSMFNLGRGLSTRKNKAGLEPTHLTVPKAEALKEEDDIGRVLDDLNLSAKNNKAFSLSKESTEMVRKFNLVLKDLVNGVPTAYGDLVTLIEDRDGILARNYEKLPSGLKKLVTQLPDKLTSTLAPELLAVAAEAQGLKASEVGKDGLKGAAKSFLTPKNLQDLVTKPGAVVGLLKGIVNALKLRWPAFIGTNVLWSVAIFLLLAVFWYCHKRGREERLAREAGEKDAPIDGSSRIEELPDDPQLPAPGAASGGRAMEVETDEDRIKLPPPPVGEHATASHRR